MSELSDRLARRDISLWPEGNGAPRGLGWLELPRSMDAAARDLRRWADTIDAGHVAVLGMGGATLPAAVLAELAATTGSGNGRRLSVCDTTDPETVAELDTHDTLFLVCSKSGVTLETRALYAHATSKVRRARSFAAITDAGTPLQTEAIERGFAGVFTGPADVSGAFSILSCFGLVPAALLGLEPVQLLVSAAELDLEAGVELGREIGEAAAGGQDKFTVVVPPERPAFGLWVEHLFATATGKLGVGCVPVPTPEREDGVDRYVVEPDPPGVQNAGAQFLHWEAAAAIAGHVLRVDPFSTPEVAASAAALAGELAEEPPAGPAPTGTDELWTFLEREAGPRDYVALHAYLPYRPPAELEQARRAVRDRLGGPAVTAGYGPRLLHSTGQMHKAGPAGVLAVQLLPSGERPDQPVPGFPYNFARMIDAAAIADRRSLLARGRRVTQVVLDDLGALS